MLSRSVRLTLIVALAAYGLFRLATGSPSGWLFLAAAASFAVGLVVHGPVMLAYQSVVTGDLKRAASLLSEIRDPSKLRSQDRAYFHWVSGHLAAAAGQHREAYQHFAAVLPSSLRTDHIRAATECALAEAALGLGDLPLARSHLEKARSLPFRSTLTPAIEALATRIESA